MNPAPQPGATHVFTGSGRPGSGDWQAFELQVPSKSKVTASVDWNATESTDLNLFLSNGVSSMEHANSTTAKPESLSTTVAAGKYEVAVKVKSGGTAAFTVSVKVVPEEAPTTTTPPTTAPPTTTPPTTTTPPPASTGWKAEYPGDVRPGRVRWGSSITGNGDPVSRHETAAGHALGIRRTYFQWGARTTGMVDMARKDLAAGRLPWVSIKPPSWAEMASGARDGEIDQMLKALDKLDGPVWLTVHHEPEGGGGNGNKADDPAGPSAWRQMQSRVRARMDALGVDNVALASILMAWTFDSRSGRNPLDWWVANTFDIAGIDYYVESESSTDIATAGQSWLKARAFYGARGVDMAVGEWGNRGTNAQAAAEMQAFYDHALNSANDGKGAQVVGLSYFDSDLNSSTGGWTLTGEPLKKFRQLLSAPTSLLQDET